MNGSWQKAMKSAAATINTIAGENVVYLRAGRQVTLRMRRQDSTWPSKNAGGMVEQWNGVDWIVTADEWASSGLDLPARGDKLQRLVNGVREVYELAAPPGLQLWDTSTYGEVFRIHTQQVAA